jgi:hypothetical protein
MKGRKNATCPNLTSEVYILSKFDMLILNKTK